MLMYPVFPELLSVTVYIYITSFRNMCGIWNELWLTVGYTALFLNSFSEKSPVSHVAYHLSEESHLIPPSTTDPGPPHQYCDIGSVPV